MKCEKCGIEEAVVDNLNIKIPNKPTITIEQELCGGCIYELTQSLTVQNE